VVRVGGTVATTKRINSGILLLFFSPRREISASIVAPPIAIIRGWAPCPPLDSFGKHLSNSAIVGHWNPAGDLAPGFLGATENLR
jgi:hypothetical protein